LEVEDRAVRHARAEQGQRVVRDAGKARRAEVATVDVDRAGATVAGGTRVPARAGRARAVTEAVSDRRGRASRARFRQRERTDQRLRGKVPVAAELDRVGLAADDREADQRLEARAAGVVGASDRLRGGAAGAVVDGDLGVGPRREEAAGRDVSRAVDRRGERPPRVEDDARLREEEAVGVALAFRTRRRVRQVVGVVARTRDDRRRGAVVVGRGSA